MNWDDIERTHRYIIPEEFKVYQYREGLEEYPDFILRYRKTPPCVIDYEDDTVMLDDGDWVVLDEDWRVYVYNDANFRAHFEVIP